MKLRDGSVGSEFAGNSAGLLVCIGHGVLVLGPRNGGGDVGEWRARDVPVLVTLFAQVGEQLFDGGSHPRDAQAGRVRCDKLAQPKSVVQAASGGGGEGAAERVDEDDTRDRLKATRHEHHVAGCECVLRRPAADVRAPSTDGRAALKSEALRGLGAAEKTRQRADLKVANAAGRGDGADLVPHIR